MLKGQLVDNFWMKTQSSIPFSLVNFITGTEILVTYVQFSVSCVYVLELEGYFHLYCLLRTCEKGAFNAHHVLLSEEGQEDSPDEWSFVPSCLGVWSKYLAIGDTYPMTFSLLTSLDISNAWDTLLS